MAEWPGHCDHRVTLETYAHIMPDAPERLRSVGDSVFTRETELTLPLGFDARAAVA
ncbi:hypothetical protein [Streptomyces roseoviridis]|uniref:Integrase n=1 Tax=Streptomyces roseoviridis TaxID=67361 RepID=A0ABV5QVJ5_9ACTN